MIEMMVALAVILVVSLAVVYVERRRQQREKHAH